MNFSLQDMVRQTLAESERRVKLASEDAVADGEDKCDHGDTKKKPTDNPQTTPERNIQSVEEKTSSVFVSKLASAVEYLNGNFLKVAVGEVLPAPSDHQPKADSDIGAGRGHGAFPTNLDAPTSGVQATEVGQATSEKILPTNPPMGENAGGETNPQTAMHNDINDRPGGDENWVKRDVFKQAAAELMSKRAAPLLGSAGVSPEQFAAMQANIPSDAPQKVARVLNVMHKMAEDFSPAVSASEEGVPALPGEAANQESLINSLQKAIDYTKGEAKAVPKERMGEVLSEPAQKKELDPVLQNNLSNTGQAGVKISSAKTAVAARALLQKIAEEGARADASPDAKEKAAKLAALLAKQGSKESSESCEEKKEKDSQMALPTSGAAMAGSPVTPMMPIGS